MIQISTGTLTYEQLDNEVSSIVDDLLSFGIKIVYLSLGGGCWGEIRLQKEEIPVSTPELPRYLSDLEAESAFELGESDLHIRGGGLDFMLYRERAVHCFGQDSPRLHTVVRRWARSYEYARQRRGEGRWHRLPGQPKRIDFH